VTLIDGGRTLQQPLDVDDLARAVLVAAGLDAVTGQTLDLVGPVVLPEREIVERAAGLLHRPVRIRSVPRGLVRLTLALRGLVAGPGFSPDALEVLTTDTRLPAAPAAASLGLTLTGLDEMIRRSLLPPEDRA